MKHIINGKTYNTETAELIAEQCTNLPRSDFNYCKESLYKTRKGAFFLTGAGGALTRWASRGDDGARWWGDGMAVLDPALALAWCERHRADPEVIERYFDIEEG